jgi:hypothetical protein
MYIKCLVTHIAHHYTTAYHPESNSAVERLYCHLKDVLRACNAAATWAEEISWVLLGLCAQPREDTGLSQAEALFGAPIVLPNKFVNGDEIPVDTISFFFMSCPSCPSLCMVLSCLISFIQWKVSGTILPVFVK